MTRINAVAVSVRAVRPGKRYWQSARVPIGSGVGNALIRTTIPADIPEDAMVTRADLVVMVSNNAAAGALFRLEPTTGRFTTRQTWNTRPGFDVARRIDTAAAGALTAYKSVVRIDVRSHVTEWITGAYTNHGWRLFTPDLTGMRIQGAIANGSPYLDLEYVVPGEPPWDTHPAGTVDTDRPTLTFKVPPQTSHIRVQIDDPDPVTGDAPDFTSPVYDSGELPSSVGLLNLAQTTFPGLVDGQTVYWRAAARNPFGLGDWSEVVSFTRDVLATGTIDTPGATAGDVTPPIGWTFPGQTAWQVIYSDAATGRVVDDTGRQAGTDTSYTPERGVAGPGRRGRLEVRWWDANTDRVASPGDPTYAVAFHEFDVVAAGTAPGVASLDVVQANRVVPVIDLTWAVGDTLPDEWQIERSGRWIARVPNDVTTFTDYTAPAWHDAAYRVLAVSNGAVSNVGPTVTLTPTIDGIWVFNPDDGARAGLLDDATGEASMAEQAVIHEVIGRAGVRRRLGTPPPTGSQEGVLMDSPEGTFSADESYTTLMGWKGDDAGQVYRVALGDWNIPATLGDIYALPTPATNGRQRVYRAGFDWFHTDDELPWGDDA